MNNLSINLLQVDMALSHSSRVDAMIPNSADKLSVLRSLKEAAATLSPIVRNRIYGIPPYILEYSDQFVANHVQAPLLKPIIVTGPESGERMALLQELVDEFPDVFAFPTILSDAVPFPSAEYDSDRFFSEKAMCISENTVACNVF